MADEEPTIVELSLHEQVLTVSLNRPETHNAMNPEMIQALTDTFRELDQRDDVRVVVLTGKGRSFCAGADLSYMRSAVEFDFEDNVAGGRALFDLMNLIDKCAKPVIGRINGAAIGGGIGLVSCCDIVIAVERARFGFSEARLGLVPAVISPFVVARIGMMQARELFLTGERFGAAHAKSIGLLNYIVADEEELDTKTRECAAQLLLSAPGALTSAKELIRTVSEQSKEAVRDYTAELIARRRASAEGQEGMAAFLEKRKPYWQ